MKIRLVFIVVLAVALVAAGCSSDGSDDGTTTSEAVQLSGEEAAALEKVALGAITGAACGLCHTIGKVGFGKIGPDLNNIATRADAAYIRESIIDPRAVIAENCPSGPCLPDSMSIFYGQTLTEEEIDAIVWYLMGLTGE